MRHDMRVILAGLGLSTLALVACKPGIDPEPPNPPEPPEEVDPEEVRADFSAVVQAHAEAAADGMSEKECKRIAQAFHAVYEKHGQAGVMAEFNAAATWEECGRTDLARPIYEQLARQKVGPALTNLGVLYWHEGDSARAVDLFEEAVAVDRKRSLTARNNLAGAYRDRFAEAGNLQDFARAEEQAQNVLATDSANLAAYENLARLYYDRGRIDDRSYLLLANLVVTQALRVLEEDGIQSAELYNLRGLLFMADDNQIDAMTAFEKAVEIDPSHVDANLNIAFIALRFRDYGQAEKSLDIVFGEPGDPDVDAQLAMAVAKRGLKKFDEAGQWYAGAQKVDPSDPRVHYNLGILHQEHLINEPEVDEKRLEKLYKSAKRHYGEFVRTAEKLPAYKDEVADARDRIVVIDDAIDTLHKMKRIKEQIADMERKEELAAQRERERIKELELRALQAPTAGPAE